MWVAIVATIASFRPVIGPVAYLLLVPYLAWVSYAAALTLWIWRHNPRQVRALWVWPRGRSGERDRMEGKG
jgi:tryptophan-rich sensory protein